LLTWLNAHKSSRLVCVSVFTLCKSFKILDEKNKTSGDEINQNGSNDLNSSRANRLVCACGLKCIMSCLWQQTVGLVTRCHIYIHTGGQVHFPYYINNVLSIFLSLTFSLSFNMLP